MKHLFSPEGQRALAAVLQRSPLLAFDFDGTLAPIVARAQDAHVSTAVAQRLQQLRQWRPVAIVTGRSVADARERLGFSPDYLIGSHGAEGPDAQAAQRCMQALEPARALLRDRAALCTRTGISIEDKGCSIALHYRLAYDRTQAQQALTLLLQQLGPDLRSFGGKCVLNLVSADAPDKGQAVLDLVQASGSGAALFVGDDVNDEPVFRIAAATWLTLRVGRDDPSSYARFFLDAHAEVATFLQMLLDLRPE